MGKNVFMPAIANTSPLFFQKTKMLPYIKRKSLRYKIICAKRTNCKKIKATIWFF
ncbi:hypothetical protein KsCSTR_11260 [Candidatus Kuenenia stuttgartiensis]|uniref:Uncharacterized protein n=1 Tax=Kuenenia stuttgartiensis TaxID=174633 RepID=Q1PYH0_KUEST|nr:hypothetical protein KsCSTR_11260 [Candidatus Kuenenia stuttgartiensis]CAJ72137.1 unknown protein [Candidatus Kuenenia stuttgartiensis]